MFIIIVVVITSIWVLFDAKYIDKQERVEDEADPGKKHTSPWEWFAFCLLLWIIGFPAYLIQRYKRSKAVTVIGLCVVGVTICLIIAGYYYKNEEQVAKQSVLNVHTGLSTSEDEFIASATPVYLEENEKGLYYKELLKNPTKYSEKKLNMLGRIFEITETDGVTYARVIISQDWDSIVLYIKGTVNVYKGDVVRIYGYGAGITNGPTMGTSDAVPLIAAKIIRKVKI